jgi:anhydro-N-acetylmuramic acid kinase
MVSRPLLVLGMMSGTSADGIDCALLTVPERPRLADARGAIHHHVAFSARQRREVFALFETPRATADTLCQMNFAMGEWFAAAAREAIAAAGRSLDEVDLIGSHGQTVFHCPPGTCEGGEAPVACTLQIGEPAVIAERTGITTVADFRVRDVAAGGHGAPLVSYVDCALFGHQHKARVVLNLGGIANVTVVPPSSAPGGRGPLAFDTGPGNMVLDWLVQRVTNGRQQYDEDGKLAAAGSVDERLLAELLEDDYFRASPPKTTGRERYGAAYAERVHQKARTEGVADTDLLATATALTAVTVAEAIVHGTKPLGAPVEVIAGGGGTRNPTLIAQITRRLPGARVSTHERYGVSSQAKEALSFAMLASAAVRGQTNSVPGCTGAQRPVVMGKILPGENYKRLMRRLHGGRTRA